MKRDFTPASHVIPRFEDVTHQGGHHLRWNGGIAWKKTLCGKGPLPLGIRPVEGGGPLEFEKIPVEIHGPFCRRCGGVAERIIDRWLAMHHGFTIAGERERMRILELAAGL